MDRKIVEEAERIHAAGWKDMYDAASPEFARATGLEVRELAQGVWQFLLPAVPFRMFNRVIGLGIAEPATEALLDTALSNFAAARCETFALSPIPDSQPAAIFDWLAARGLTVRDEWALLTRLAEPVPTAAMELTIREIDPTEAHLFGRTLSLGYEMPEEMGLWASAFVGRPGWKAFLACDGDEPVGCAAFYHNEGAAWFGPAATLREHRGRGSQSVLFARRIAEANALGCRLLLTETPPDTPDAPNPSYRNMIRAGFTEAYRRLNYSNEGK